MKTNLVRRGARGGWGFTLLEVLFVVLIVGILAMLLLPVVERSRSRSRQVNCGSNLRQLGISFHSFAHDHGNGFPFQVPTAAGGSKEFLQSSFSMESDFYFAYRHFQPLSNDLAEPRILVCPSDTQRTPAMDFVELRNRNISFVLGVSASYQEPDSVLAADRNILLNGQTLPALALIDQNANLGWNSQLHDSRGNLLHADGSVRGVTPAGLNTSLANRTGARLLSPLVPSSGGSLQAGSSGGGGGGEPAPAASGGSSGSSGSDASSGSSGFSLLQQAFSTGAGGSSSRSPSSSSSDNSPASTPSNLDPQAARGSRTSSGDFAASGQEPIPLASGAAKTSAKPAMGLPVPAEEPPAKMGEPEPLPPAHMGTILARPQSCWWCWLLMFLGMILALIGLAFAIRFRNIRLRRKRALAQFGR